uniref:Uncharacterized protein n=1 Tax=Geobacter sp. (strain M21) TaxID=443144 RepID=C6DZ93_GEOSM
MAKTKLNQRLEPETLERLRRMQATQRVSFEDLVCNAIDALEREQNLPETLLEHLDNLRESVALLDERLELLEAKMDEASFNEKERLEYLFRLVETELKSHSQAIQARLDRITPPRSL